MEGEDSIDQDPIKGRMVLEAFDQRRVRWSLARTLLFEMEIVDLELVAGTGFLGDGILGHPSAVENYWSH